jgi:hypothetical protein
MPTPSSFAFEKGVGFLSTFGGRQRAEGRRYKLCLAVKLSGGRLVEITTQLEYYSSIDPN